MHAQCYNIAVYEFAGVCMLGQVFVCVCVCVLSTLIFFSSTQCVVVEQNQCCTVVQCVVPRLLTQPHQNTPPCVICEARLSFNNWLLLRLEAFISPSLSSRYWPQPAVIVLTTGHVAGKKNAPAARGREEKRTEVKYLFFFFFLNGQAARCTDLRKPV